MPTMRVQQSTLSSASSSLDIVHGLHKPPFRTALTTRLALAWVGLLVGLGVLALQGALLAWLSAERPRLIAHGPEDSPWVIPLATGAFPAVSGPGESSVVMSADHGWFPHHRLARDVCEADDDDPVTGAIGTVAMLSWPPASREGIPGGTPRHCWPSRFLVRPQLLTRL
jgi:hypothetical protein